MSARFQFEKYRRRATQKSISTILKTSTPHGTMRRALTLTRTFPSCSESELMTKNRANEGPNRKI